MPETVDAPVVKEPEKASIFEDFIDIIVSPAAVFARRAESGFFLPLVLVTVLVGALYLANRGVMAGIMDGEFARQSRMAMERNPQVTAEQMEGMRNIMETMSTVGVFIVMPIAMLLIGLGVLIVGRIFGAPLTFGASATIAVWSYVPRVVESIGIAIQGLLLDTSMLTGRYQLSLGVGRFLDPDATNMGLLSIVGRLDLFTLWITVLIGIGISVVGKIPRGKAFGAAVVLWCVGALPGVWQLVMG